MSFSKSREAQFLFIVLITSSAIFLPFTWFLNLKSLIVVLIIVAALAIYPLYWLMGYGDAFGHLSGKLPSKRYYVKKAALTIALLLTALLGLA